MTELTSQSNTDIEVTPDDAQENRAADFREAFYSVPSERKKQAYYMLGAAGVTLAVLFFSRLIFLFEPLFDKIYYGLLSELIYYMILLVIVVGYSVALGFFVKKMCEDRLYMPRKQKLSVPQALGVILTAAVAVFIVSAIFKFKVKIQVEMGYGVTMAKALTNIAVYVYYALHVWLALSAATLVQRALERLLPTKYSVPWSAVFLVTVFGLIELILELTTTSHLYPWMYYLFTYAYAIVFVLTQYSFHLTFWTAVVILVL